MALSRNKQRILDRIASILMKPAPTRQKPESAKNKPQSERKPRKRSVNSDV